jgi:hypothetical protein
MHRVALLAALLVMCNIPCSAAADWPLITKEEFQRNQAAPRPGTRSLRSAPAAGVPTIDVEQPNPAKPIKSPVTIIVHFHAQDGAVINPSSIRVTYGWLGIDITSRVLEHAELTVDGLSATNARLPSGKHSVTISIKDSKGRQAVRDFDFTVL